MNNEEQKEINKNFNKKVRNILSKQPDNYQKEDMILIKLLEEDCERDKKLSKGSSLEEIESNENTSTEEF